MMTCWHDVLFLCCLLSMAAASCRAQQVVVGGDGEEEMVRVKLSFANGAERASFQQEVLQPVDRASSWDLHQVTNFKRTSVVAASIPKSQFDTLAEEAAQHNVTMVQDSKVRIFQAGEEIVPYGIEIVQGNLPGIPDPTPDECFKVCVVDSGLFIDHLDIPFARGASNIDGNEFGLAPGEQWWNPSSASSHGTHVTGTIFAEGGNDLGVVGVVPNPQGMCLLVARVFDDSGVTDSSFIMEAVEWCADNGARVINMSLGGREGTSDEQDLYREVWEEGVMVVAAAGNDGGNRKSFPAGFPEVVSVAAVDQDLEQAAFSQANDEVDVSAPGVDVISTTAEIAVQVLDIANNRGFVTSLMEFSPDPFDNNKLEDVGICDCGLAFEECQGCKDRVCIIERGETFFYEKALNCQAGEGVGAIVYNNEQPLFGGSLSSWFEGVEIPVVSTSRSSGEALLDGTVDTISFFEAATGYISLDGTSMAAPPVTGVAAKVWAARPGCTNVQVREALLATSIPLGKFKDGSDRNDEFGHGLVQAVDAYNYLVDTFEEPCGLSGSIGSQNCSGNGASCILDSDCCSQECRRISVSEYMCRPLPKAAKNKLGGESRGGAASGRLRRRLRGQ